MGIKCKIIILSVLVFNSYCYLYSLSFKPSFGFSIECGSTREFVNKDNAAVSELIWDNPLVIKLETGCKIEIEDFFLNAFLTSCIPNGYGSIRDYDYKDGQIIRYSWHENYVDKDLSTLLDFGYKFRIGKLSIAPFLGCKYSNKKYSAWGGYLQEPSEGSVWTGDEEKLMVTGNGMSYEQQIIVPFAGLAAEFNIGKRLAAGAQLSYCPCICADCLDSHYVRTKQFYDKIRSGRAVLASVWFVCDENIFTLACKHIESSENSSTFQSSIGIGSPSDSPVSEYVPGFRCDKISLTMRHCF